MSMDASHRKLQTAASKIVHVFQNNFKLFCIDLLKFSIDFYTVSAADELKFCTKLNELSWK